MTTAEIAREYTFRAAFIATEAQAQMFKAAVEILATFYVAPTPEHASAVFHIGADAVRLAATPEEKQQ